MATTGLLPHPMPGRANRSVGVVASLTRRRRLPTPRRCGGATLGATSTSPIAHPSGVAGIPRAPPHLLLRFVANRGGEIRQPPPQASSHRAAPIPPVPVASPSTGAPPPHQAPGCQSPSPILVPLLRFVANHCMPPRRASPLLLSSFRRRVLIPTQVIWFSFADV